MSARHVYLFGGPANGAVVTVPAGYDTLDLPEPPKHATLDLADPASALVWHLRRHRYVDTGERWHNPEFGYIAGFVYHGSVD